MIMFVYVGFNPNRSSFISRTLKKVNKVTTTVKSYRNPEEKISDDSFGHLVKKNYRRPRHLETRYSHLN